MTMTVDPELNLFQSDPALLRPGEAREYERAAAALAVLTDPDRLLLLHALVLGEDTAQRAALWADLPQARAERELAVMADAEIVERRDTPRGPVYLPRDGHLVVLIHVALAHGREDRAPARHPRLLGGRRRARSVR